MTTNEKEVGVIFDTSIDAARKGEPGAPSGFLTQILASLIAYGLVKLCTPDRPTQLTVTDGQNSTTVAIT